ncbi:MAG: recombinase family protein [Candidatus Methylarchaceae archaeon HK02M2]|nr:recombinase family protein [Candidatus Methylarchaceae archaeon HK02M2]
MSLKERTTVCRVCNKEKPHSEFCKKDYGDVLLIDTICLKCAGFGRPSLDELMARPHAGGRPEQILPLQLIQDLYNQGYGFKRIARILREQGINTSHTTVRNKLINNKN